MRIKTYLNLTHEFLGNPVIAIQTIASSQFYDRLTEIIINESKSFLETNGYDPTTKPFVGLTGFSGYKRFNILDWDFDECRLIKDVFLRAFEIYLNEFKSQYHHSRPNYITCWPNIIANYDGKVCAHSHHPNPFNISGIYYLAGDFDCGLIQTNFWPKDHQKTIEKVHSPAQGDIIMFPSNLVHLVLPYPKETYRISLAFDIFFERDSQVSYIKIKSELRK
jgi:hypothetical protein